MSDTVLASPGLAPEAIDSPFWYRVADIVPRLRPTVRVRHRGATPPMRHVLADTLTGRHHLVDEASWAFVGRFDGRRTIGEIWQWLCDHVAEPPTQHEVLEWLAMLDNAGLLQCEKLPDLNALLRGQVKAERRRRQASLNPLSWRVPLGDPTRWLTRLGGLAALVWHPVTLGLALLLVLAGVAQVALEGPALQAALRQRLASPAFLALSWGVYPVIKAVHEFGHALALRRFGAEVRHVGVGFLYLLPAPYVDASAASGLAARHERVLISAAGVITELVLAACGVLVWAAVEPGVVRDVALAVALVGGVSTLLANANPLVRMDGYHVLTDLIDCPNLAARSRRWWLDLLRLVLAHRGEAPGWPTGTVAQRIAVVTWAPLAWVFGAVVALSACLWLARTSALVALTVGLIALWLQAGRPVLAGLGWLLRAPELAGRRLRAGVMSVAGLGGALALLLGVPLPHATTAQALAWMPEEALVRAPVDGFVVALHVPTQRDVARGTPLLQLANEVLPVELAGLRARRLALEVAAGQAQVRDPAAAQRAEAQIRALARQEAQVAARLAELAVASARAGRVSWVDPETLVGRYVRRGDVLGHVLADDRLVARTVVPGEDTADLLTGVRAVEVRLLDTGAVHAGRWDGVVPETGLALPSAALGLSAGGAIETDPADSEGLRTLAPVAVIDVQVPDRVANRLGARLLVRFDHGARPLGERLLRRWQQLVLRHFGEATDVPGGR